MKIKESIFKLLSLLFILTFTNQQAYSQRIDTDIGVEGLFNVTKSNYESVLSYGSTFLCLSEYELQLYDEPGSPNSDFGTKKSIYRSGGSGMIAAVSAINEKANYYGYYLNYDKYLVEISIASFDLEEKDYNLSFAHAGVFVDSNPEDQEIIGITELQESTLLFGYRGARRALFMEINHSGEILQEIEITNDVGLSLLSVTEDENNRYFIFAETSFSDDDFLFLRLDKTESLTQEKFDNQIESISNLRLSFGRLGAQTIVVNGKLICSSANSNLEVSVSDLATKQTILLEVMDKMPLNSTFKSVHIKEDGTILVTGILNDEQSYPLFVMALDSDGELVSNFGINGFYFLEIEEFSENVELNNTYYNNGRLVFSVSDQFVGNFFIPIVFDNFVETEQEEFAEFSLYPNPCTSFIGIDSERLQEVDEITIYDTNGSRIIRQEHNGSNKLSIDIAELKAATYFISFFKNDKLVGSQSFIKQ